MLRKPGANKEEDSGIGTKHVQDASYPFLIQEKYRAGYFTHYAGEGTVRSTKLSYKGEDVLEKNEMIRFQYKAMFDRITKFDFE